MSDIPSTPARTALPHEAVSMVTQREFEQRMFSLQQQITEQISAQKELHDARAEALAQALGLQAREYERRLAELNHAHELAAQNWRQSLPREMFEAALSQWQKWRDEVNASMIRLSQLPTEVASVEARLKLKEASSAAMSFLPATVAGMDARLKAAEMALQQYNGALMLIRFMGVAGVIALIVTFLRMAKVVP